MENVINVSVLEMNILGVDMVEGVSREYLINGKPQIRRYKRPMIKYNCKLWSDVAVKPNQVAMSQEGHTFQAINEHTFVNHSIYLNGHDNSSAFTLPCKMIIFPVQMVG